MNMYEMNLPYQVELLPLKSDSYLPAMFVHISRSYERFVVRPTSSDVVSHPSRTQSLTQCESEGAWGTSLLREGQSKTCSESEGSLSLLKTSPSPFSCVNWDCCQRQGVQFSSSNFAETSEVFRGHELTSFGASFAAKS